MQTESVHTGTHLLLYGRKMDFQSALTPDTGVSAASIIKVIFGIADRNATGTELEGVLKQCHLFSCFPLAINLAFHTIFLIFQEKPFKVQHSQKMCKINSSSNPVHSLLKNKFSSFRTMFLRTTKGGRREKIQRHGE